QSEKAIGGNRDNLQEDKEIEEIAGHHHALDAHDEQQEEQQYSVSFARDVRGTKKCDQIDAECEDTFAETHAQIDCIGRLRTARQNFDRCRALQERQYGIARNQRHSRERKNKDGRNPGLAEAIEHRNQKSGAQAYNEDVKRMKKTGYHFDSVKASIDSVFFES